MAVLKTLNMFNQIFILDLKGKVLVARNYRGELDSNVIDKFMPLLMEKGEKKNEKYFLIASLM